jgi:MFS family permease
MTKLNDSIQAQGNTSGIFYGYVVAIAAFFICFAAFGIRFCYGIFFTPMSTELGWNNATTALAFSISALMEGVFNIILGGMTDKYGPRLILTVCGIIIGLGYCLMPLVHSMWQFYVFYGLIVGMGMGGIFVPLITVIARWFKVRRNLVSGLVVSGNCIGLLVVSPLTTSLITSHGWRNTFLIFGIAITMIIVVAAQFLKRDPSTMGLLPDGKPTNPGEEKLPVVTGLSFREAMRSKQLWLVLSIFFTMGFYFVGNQIYIVPDALKTGMSNTTAAYILSTMGLVNVVGMVGLGAAGDKIGNKRVFIFCFILCLLASVAVITNSLPASFFVFAVFAGLAIGGMSASMSPLVASLFGLKSHGVIFGFCGFGNTVGQAVGPFIVGSVLDYNHNYNIALSVCASLVLIGLILMLFLKPDKKTHPSSTKF